MSVGLVFSRPQQGFPRGKDEGARSFLGRGPYTSDVAAERTPEGGENKKANSQVLPKFRGLDPTAVLC